MNGETKQFASGEAPLSLRRYFQQDKPLWFALLLSLVSGVILALPFLRADFYLFAWFAFVPVLIAIESLKDDERKYFKVYFSGLMFGLVFYLCVAYWIVDFLVLFKRSTGLQGFLIAFGFWFFCAQLPAALFVVFAWVKRQNIIHELILFPVLVITFYTAFPGVLSSQLGAGQSQFKIAIQAADIVGVQGLDGMLALVNIFIVCVLMGRVKRVASIVTCSLVILWFSYGFFVYADWKSKVSSWDLLRIGIVQPNDIPSTRESNAYMGYSRAFPPEMEMTERLADAGAEIVVWPESRYKNYFDSKDVQEAYVSKVKQLQTNLFFQDLENIRNFNDADSLEAKRVRYNSVAAISREGQQLSAYRKNLRVIFGEYLPEIQALPFLSVWLREFLGDFNSGISAGNGHHNFSLEGKTFIPLICYETLFPNFVAEAVSENGQGGILLGLSNDNWFGETIQTYQHLNASKLRAVENRLPFIIALNGGPSLAVMPSGDVVFETDAFQAGAYLADIPYSKDSGGSFFSRHPRLFLYSIYGLTALIFLLAIVRKINRRLLEKNWKK
ncbi:apolipoprotein N-acyltransferase [Aurantivibrio infirmus]